MGNKVHPIAFRLGNLYTWSSRWFGEGKRYQDFLIEDVKLRESLMKRLKPAGIARVDIERSINKVEVIVHVARPGVVIGRGGAGVEDLKKEIAATLKINSNDKRAAKLEVKVEPVKEPNLNAYFVASNIADQLVKRMPAKRVMSQAIEKTMAVGAKGVRVRLGGRINGAEIARVQHDQRGVLPLSTIREDIDFASVPALTRSGYVGVKVWISRKKEG